MAKCITANMTSDVCPHEVTTGNNVYDVINVTIDKSPEEICEAVENDVPVIVTGLFPVGINEDGSAMLIKVTTYVSGSFSDAASFKIKYDNWFNYGAVPVSPSPVYELFFSQGPSNNSVREVAYIKD